MGLLSSSREDGQTTVSRREHGLWGRLLAPGEQLQEIFRIPRTTLLFTSRRLIFVDEALTGRQVDYVSVPYRSVSHFQVEASGPFSNDADLRIWISGRATPIEKAFRKDVDVYAVQALLARHLAG